MYRLTFIYIRDKFVIFVDKGTHRNIILLKSCQKYNALTDRKVILFLWTAFLGICSKSLASYDLYFKNIAIRHSGSDSK